MKKITLFFALSFVSLIGFAQESKNSTKLDSESIERQSEYIIVLDDTTVDNNIDMLLINCCCCCFLRHDAVSQYLMMIAAVV